MLPLAPLAEIKIMEQTIHYFSQQKLKIIELISEGLCVEEIAERLCIEKSSVAWNIAAIAEELDIHSHKGSPLAPKIIAACYNLTLKSDTIQLRPVSPHRKAPGESFKYKRH